MGDPRESLKGSRQGATNLIKLSDISRSNNRKPKTYINPEDMAREKSRELIRNFLNSVYNKVNNKDINVIETCEISIKNLAAILRKRPRNIETILTTSEGTARLNLDLKDKILPFYQITLNELAILSEKLFAEGMKVRNPQYPLIMVKIAGVSSLSEFNKNILIEVSDDEDLPRKDIVSPVKLAYTNIDILYLKLKGLMGEVSVDSIRSYIYGIRNRSC